MESTAERKAAKFRLLCLHGIGTNSDVRRPICSCVVHSVNKPHGIRSPDWYVAALRYQLGNEYEFEFVDGAYPWPAARGISEVFGKKQIYYSYFDGSAESVLEAVKDLAEYTIANGPFDAVMGFSLGAALAMTLLLYSDKLGLSQVPLKCAIILCGTLPCDWDSLEKGEVQLLSAADTCNAVHIPTIHFWSPEDVDYPAQSSMVVKMCSAANRLELIHSAGHCLPTQSQQVTELAQAIKDIMAKF